jgi:hypothetical protein
MKIDEIEARANAATFHCWAEAAFNCAREDVPALIARVRELETQLRIERENVAELEERLVLCQRTNDRMRERLGHKPPPWGMNK